MHCCRKHCPDCHFNLGNLYLKTGEKASALMAFRAAISQNKSLRHAWSNLVILLDELDDFTTAEEECLSARELFPAAPEFAFHLGNIYGKQDRFPDAEKMWEQQQQ